MTKQFGRAWSLNASGKNIVGLDIEFRVERSLKATQNTAEFTIFNLSADTRKFLSEQKRGAIVEFRAGYKDQEPLPRLFLGDLRVVTSLREGADWRTEISNGDGDQKKKKPISFSLGPGTTFENAVKRIVSEMGATIGSTAALLAKGKFSDASKQFSDGFTAHGNGDEELRKLLSAGGLEHSYQNGEIQILEPNGDLANTAVLLKLGTGLVGSPEVGTKGAIKVRSLLNADIAPGRVVRVEAANVSGFYVVKKASYLGGTATNDWYTDAECGVRA